LSLFEPLFDLNLVISSYAMPRSSELPTVTAYPTYSYFTTIPWWWESSTFSWWWPGKWAMLVSNSYSILINHNK